MSAVRLIISLLFLCLAGPLQLTLAGQGGCGDSKFAVELRKRDRQTGQAECVAKQIDPRSTAIVVVDMWDSHWCKTFTQRVGNHVPRMDKTLDAARKLGIRVLFAPSDVIDFYTDYPQRKAVLEIAEQPQPTETDFDLPPQPIGKDCCECGPDMPCKTRKTWTRQHKDLRIEDGDLLIDNNNKRELFNVCAKHDIKTLIYMGVASNMCVLNRQCGMRTARKAGFEVIFVRDLVEAITANGADPASKQVDWNFTPARGSAIIRRWLEQEVAPSIESRQLLAAAGKGGLDKRPNVVFVIAEQEYETDRTLPAFAAECLQEDFDCTFVIAEGNDGPARNNVPGLEALYDADLLVLSMRRRALPVVQMDHLEKFIRSGKPLVVIRTSVAAFQVKPESRPVGHVIWHDFDKEVLGVHYQGYDAQARETGCKVWPVKTAIDHPILSGIDAGGFHSTSWIYKLRNPAEGTKVLMEGRWGDDAPVEPAALINDYNGARVFYTSLGHPEDFRNTQFRKLLKNAICWALER